MKKVINTTIWNNKDFSTPLCYARNDKEHLSFRPKWRNPFLNVNMKEYYIYIVTNFDRTVLYIGVTNDLIRRVYEHKNHLFNNSFTDKYNCGTCIYYERFNDINQALERETQLKKWSRKKKENLIISKNPGWISLVDDNEIINIDEIIPNVNVDGGFLDSTPLRSK